jgi:hypothetical protein
MARQVLDSIVFEKIDALKLNRQLFSGNPAYFGTATDTIQRVKLDRSENGLRNYGTCARAKGFYDSLKLKEGETYLKLNGQRFPATSEQVRMIKALAVEQINRNEEYSIALGHCLSVVLKATISKFPVNAIIPEDGMTTFQNIVVEEFSTWVGSVLGERNE